MPFYPPQEDGSQPLPLLEDVTGDNFGRFRHILTKAGLDDVGDLSAMTEHDVQQVKGIGPKALVEDVRPISRTSPGHLPEDQVQQPQRHAGIMSDQ